MRGRLVSLAAAAAFLIAPSAALAADAPWKEAGRVTDGLFDAQTELVLDGPDAAAKDVARARGAYDGDLRDTLRVADPAADQAITGGLKAAAQAVRADDQAALAAARGTIRAGLFRGAYVGDHRGHRAR